MPDHYGSLPMPVPAGSRNQAVGDPLLDVLCDFFAAVLRAKAGAAWDAISPVSKGIVKQTWTHNPGAEAFRPQQTPAFYLWRDQIFQAKQIAADWRIRPSRLIFRWVAFPAVQQERLREYEPFFNAIPSILDNAVERGREPTWIVQGDTDPATPLFGSLLTNYIDVYRLIVGREEIRRVELQIPVEGGATTNFRAFDIPLELEERMYADPALWPEEDAIQTTITAPGPPGPPDLVRIDLTFSE